MQAIFLLEYISQLFLIFSALTKTVRKVTLTLSHLCFWEMCNCFLFEVVLCELTLILCSQLEEMASQQGLLVQLLVLMLCHSAVLRDRST